MAFRALWVANILSQRKSFLVKSKQEIGAKRNQSSCLRILLLDGYRSVLSPDSRTFLTKEHRVNMKSQTLEKIDDTKFTSLDHDQETFGVGGQGSDQITHPGTLLPPGLHDVGTDMISDV
jgi:hypothetical protein